MTRTSLTGSWLSPHFTPFFFGTRALFKPRNPFAVDPTVERAHHYIRPNQKTDADLCPSRGLAAISDEEERSADDAKKSLTRDGKPTEVSLSSHEKGRLGGNKDKVIFSFRIMEPESSDNTKLYDGEDGDGSDRVTLDAQQLFHGQQMMKSGPALNECHSDSTGTTWDKWD